MHVSVVPVKRRRHVLVLLIALVAPAALAGCGDDESSTVTETVSVSTTTETSSTQEETTGTQSSATTGEDDLPPADQTVTMLSGFTSPTGNIGCYIDPSTVRCDIQDRDWKPPPAPADCKLDYGQGISLSSGAEAEFVCAGDTALGAGEPIPYGASIASGLLRCESERSGMTCLDVETGRGFTLAQQGYEIF